ncbi:mycobactin biosynthesis acyl-ACP dehydrogenase MbtN [Mycobacterium montefiorense]|uniref:Acyl-[acyl-carrier-protein] dehydrogenase MbtN n=1 Tax=Mycobacterium montefiorense TaxID=154654 RepID=A0AA37UYX1_9MYCO|nr:mycobactin biosynthesis acyl-ACP dehydrogenase MbtN [Mycobacterium montefiorense]GBG39746.1 acyl-[acyl-carrier-protein] dehydrogenase MbtN [Mycobacterium montefiorense]GKU35617.1 acyl-[acyl-carrier-protein] dehydrogenase MbtN [Mycobacterium montefiorense]GKU40622.1 acyl-[acyl-carrier-protein] dehydrogenase MbtN [Mycobacterium montefiorense]GKU45125.1 acyl-[acyl-carrier-protein] dehydrogenase MbtN [Mycobacterium montefiorense]GKU51275.1 acyl-[acyl-carrier-protein] dehydrogenase MbtN [Mycobac
MTTTSQTVFDADYRALLSEVFDDRVSEWTAEAEAQQRFPRKLIEHLGSSGVFAAKWTDQAQPDVSKIVELAFALGHLASAGIGVGVSLHDSAIALLRRFGKSDYLQDICEKAIRGDAVLCIGASEESGGSDLQIVETEVRSRDGGFEVRGIKKFVSLSPIADYIMVVARSVDHDSSSRHGNVVVVAVPTTHVDVQRPYDKVGAGPLDTAAVHIDTWVPADAMVARAGTGLAAISWGLAHERMSIAGQIAASCQRVIGITLARMMVRRQFGQTLFEHQALRLRMADLQARVDQLRFALHGIAAQGRLDLRAAAGIKVTAARLGEEVIGECMHIFGGAGYLVDETPLGRLWRDMKLARVGGGTDEILWELVAAGMKADHEGYEDWVGRSNA